ncbi:MAG: hypothetical protein WBJ29_02645 [Fervidobacterium sp.]
MNYVELIIAIIVSTIIVITALDGFGQVLFHMSNILQINRTSLRLFHMINYIRFDFHRHATITPNGKITSSLSSTSFSFDEIIDNEVKRVLYKIVGPTEGKYTLKREVYEKFDQSYKLLNTRTYTLEKLLSLHKSSDGRFLVISSDLYGDAIVPLQLPSVQIVNINLKRIE